MTSPYLQPATADQMLPTLRTLTDKNTQGRFYFTARLRQRGHYGVCASGSGFRHLAAVLTDGMHGTHFSPTTPA